MTSDSESRRSEKYLTLSPTDPRLDGFLDGDQDPETGLRPVLVEYQDSSARPAEAGWMFRWIDPKAGSRPVFRWLKGFRTETWILFVGPIVTTAVLCFHRRTSEPETTLTEALAPNSAAGPIEFLARVGVALLGALLFQTGVHWLNDESDYRKGWDRVGLRGGSRVLSRGLIAARTYRTAAYALLGLSVVVGLSLILSADQPLPLFAIAGSVAGLEVLNRQFGLKYRGYAEVAAWFFYGPLLCLGTAIALNGNLNWTIVVLGIASGSTALLSLHLKGMSRMLEDALAGHRTWPVRTGFDASKGFAAFCFAAQVLALPVLIFLEHDGSLLIWMLAMSPSFIYGSVLIYEIVKMKSPASSNRVRLYYRSLVLAWLYHLGLVLGAVG